MNVTFIINNINPDLFPDFDPRNPPHTTPDGVDDSIHADAKEVIERLNSATSESDLRRTIWEAFREMFMGEIVGDSDSKEYQDAVFDVWKYYCR